MLQFCHYLLGQPFQLYIDHTPLQWLSPQKMEGMLALWSLAIQEYDFKIVYRKGSSNTNADALSRIPKKMCVITTQLPHYSPMALRASQSNDDTLSVVLQARSNSEGQKME